jgi:hypothetical protein
MHGGSGSAYFFNNAFSATQSIQRRMKGREVNDELQKMWEKVVVA